jgi:CBS domain-containing protein
MSARTVSPAPERTSRLVAAQAVTKAMTSPILCVRANTSLGDALRAMVDSGRRHLVVIDEDGRCVGVLADRAIAAAWSYEPDALVREPVTAVLEPTPATVDAAARVVDAARLMRETNVDAVAVVNADRHPVGILTGSDLVSLLAR